PGPGRYSVFTQAFPDCTKGLNSTFGNGAVTISLPCKGDKTNKALSSSIVELHRRAASSSIQLVKIQDFGVASF
ncbi:MAG: hypothetical protein ACREDR_47700, partial [Blastocatellia bacterium]